ncbi:hypothetical protein SCUCBS95973_005439 [Sporothrix curviconia]|uniref:CID domain-containing protein n=1 Tax=Sporothrix curviconia TaxID=1260050 RepID=A0ABP0BWX1_9PEZI
MSGNASPFNVRFPAKPATKKSVFERQRAEAEAKRQREAAETAAVYEEFVKSFDDGSDTGSGTGSGATGGASMHHPPARLKSGATVGTTGGRRHFSIPSTGPGGHRNSGPGSLGPVHHGSRPARDARPSRQSSGLGSKLGYGDGGDDDDNGNGGSRRSGRDADYRKRKAADSDEEGQIVDDRGADAMDWAEEKANSKPTIRLTSLPPGTSPAAIKALVASNSSLVVDAVRVLPTATAAAAATDRKSVAAIVTLSAETAASDIDAAVSAMQNRYLGFGYYLNLHRHLSSAVAALSTGPSGVAGGGSNNSINRNSNNSNNSSGGLGASARPFGARPVPPAPKPGPGVQHHASEAFAPPGTFQGGRHGRGIPPPPTFTTSPASSLNLPSRDGLLYVPVRPPRDIKKLRMIHKVVEQVLDRGPEFEALLMSRPSVQLEEKWAWLWDARSEAGVWYRYRLWETVTGMMRTQKTPGLAKQQAKGRYVPLFEGSHAWKTPDHFLPYEFDTSLAELVSDSDYNSSDGSDVDGAAGAGAAEANNDEDKDTFLNPLEKARLTHLLARMPTTLSKLRKGDVARVTAFALTHASRGANEIVDMIVANIECPLAYTAANPDYQRPGFGIGDEKTEAVDTSGAQLIAVYVVSDILSSSATSGIRHAWRFRQLFDAALRRRNVFATLGRLADKFHWGRLRADKWKRSIGLVLGHWEGWSVFSAETQAFLVASFENPPRAKGGQDRDGEGATAAAQAADQATTAVSAKKSRWKTVDTTASMEQGSTPASGFRLVDTAARGDSREKMMQITSEDIAKGGGEAAGNNDNANENDNENDNDNDNDSNNSNADDAADEWAYRSDYTDDEALDLACMSDEDIDGEPMEPWRPVLPVANSRASLHRRRRCRRHRYDGIPLTADEISALVGDVAEMSEEGEVATDDNDNDDDDGGDLGGEDDEEAYHLSSVSSLSDSSNSSSETGSETGSDDNGGDDGGAGHDSHDSHSRNTGNSNSRRDVAMNDAPPPPPPPATTTMTTNTTTAAGTAAETTGGSAAGKTMPASASAAASAVQAPPRQTQAMPSMPPLSMLKASVTPSQPRKRMRAADMFADSDEEEP